MEKTYENKEVKKRIKSEQYKKNFERWLEKLYENDALQQYVLDDIYISVVNLTKRLNIDVKPPLTTPPETPI